MNYFELYGLPEHFNIDLQILKKKFLELSRKYHPDFHTLSDTVEQDRILELSTLNNTAYNTLKDPTKRTEYILTLNGLLGQEKEDAVPQDFLMEMMDINEKLMELEFDLNKSLLAEATKEVDAFAVSIDDEISGLKKEYDVNNSLKSILESIKIEYLKSKYVIRLKEKLKIFNNQSTNY